MQKKITFIIVVFLIAGILFGCSTGNGAHQNNITQAEIFENESATSTTDTVDNTPPAVTREPSLLDQALAKRNENACAETEKSSAAAASSGAPHNDASSNNTNRRVTIENNMFMVNGQRLWINGANTPWNKWNDFGGGYNDAWWDKHFAQLHEAGINAVRVWINCNNDNDAILIDDSGFVSGVSDKHWTDLDLFFETAERNHIYIMATLLSFDHFKNANNSRPDAQKWRNMITDPAAADSFVENYTIPFVTRYGDNPWLWSIDLCNEPDWIYENQECGNIAWKNISYLFAVSAAAIHENSEVLVTVGMSFPKYNADGPGYDGNKVSDKYLQNLYNNELAYLDFWSPHYYDWVGPWYDVPFYTSPYGARPSGWGLDASKPALIGECMAKGSRGETKGTENNTLTTDYENAYQNGWQGVMPWTSNGVDNCGNFDDVSPATRYMLEKYGDIIFPEE